MTGKSLRLAAALLILPLAAIGQAPEPELTPSRQMDKLFDFWNRADQPGFAVVVVKDGQVVYQNVFGAACQEHLSPITPQTVFNVSALGKPVVGMAVALLEKAGKLSLDDDVRKYIPELPDFGAPVKIRHLLGQTSGLRDWMAVLQLAGRERDEWTIDKVLALAASQKKLLFAPGDRFQNSDTDYDLLAEIVKRVTGKPFSDWAWENVFKPLKMTRTQFRDNCRSIFEDEALSYNFTRSEYLRGIDNLSLVGSHSLFTSIVDLGKWLINYETKTLGEPEVFAKILSPGQLNDGRPANFSYGLNARPSLAGRQYIQTGSWAGSQATLVAIPEKKFGFAVLANWDYTPITGFIAGIMEIYFPRPPAPAKPPAAPPSKTVEPAAPAKAVKIKPDILDSYAGDYRFGPGTILSFVREGDGLVLFVQGTKYPLAVFSETEFRFEAGGARIQFRKDESGKVNRLHWNQGGSERMVMKVELVKLTPEQLREYAGVYENEEIGLRFDIAAGGDALTIAADGRDPVRLAPDEKDRFTTSSRTIPLVVFQRDGQSRITGFIIDSEQVRDLVFGRRTNH